jgi:hypothetical protein
VADAEPTILVSSRNFQKREHADLRTPAFVVFLDEAVLKSEFGVADSGFDGVTGRTVECERRDDMELAIRNEAVV